MIPSLFTTDYVYFPGEFLSYLSSLCLHIYHQIICIFHAYNQDALNDLKFRTHGLITIALCIKITMQWTIINHCNLLQTQSIWFLKAMTTITVTQSIQFLKTTMTIMVTPPWILTVNNNCNPHLSPAQACHHQISHQNHHQITIPLSPRWYAIIYQFLFNAYGFTAWLCNSEGKFLPEGSPPPPKQNNANDWSPYEDEIQFRCTDFLYQKVEMSAPDINYQKCGHYQRLRAMI